MCSFVKKPGLSQEEIQGLTSGIHSKNKMTQQQSQEPDFRKYELGIQYNFIALNGRSSIKIGVMLSKFGWTLSLFDDPDNNQPERKKLIVAGPLEAAQKFINTKYVDLDLQPC